VEPAYDGTESFGMLRSGVEELVDLREYPDDEEDVEWALD
jgi:hypothetical protein